MAYCCVSSMEEEYRWYCWMMDDKAIKRFRGKIGSVEPSGCTPWLGTTTRGYGSFSYQARSMAAHRISYELSKGPIPAGLVIDHLCRNPACVNPDHLEAVTNKENIQRGRAGRHEAEKTHCKHGHPFDDSNTRHTSRGKRECRACWRTRSSNYNKKKRLNKIT